MRKRTPSEIKAYGDGYAEAYKEFCHLLDRHDKDKAIRKMKIFADAVALTVETATDTADTPQTDLPTEEFVEGMKNLKMEVKQTDCDKCIWSVCNYNRVDWDADTPQTDCEKCEHWKYIAHEWQCETEKCQKTPQTDCGWK